MMARRRLLAPLLVLLALASVSADYYYNYDGGVSSGYGSYGDYPDDCDYYGDCDEDSGSTEPIEEIKNTQAQVTNGDVTKKPYMMALYKLQPWGQLRPALCGGFLYILPRREAAFVVTSAQCIRRQTSPCQYKAVSQLWDMNDIAAAQEKGQVYDIVSVVRHPGFTESTLNNDIALLKLKHIPDTQPSVNLYNPANLQLLQDGTKLAVLGWGSNSSSTRIQGKLLKGQVIFEDLADCRAAYANDSRFRGRPVTDSMMCTVSTDQDACLGDLGGPLVEEGEERALDLAAGIISWGTGCAQTGMPSVYTSIGALRGWIDETMQRMAKDNDEGRC